MRDRGVAIYPTDTVYGADADALVRDCGSGYVFAIKMHPTPVSLAVSGYGMIADVSVCDADTMELIRKLLPGLITVILPKKPVPDILTAGSDRVGIRYPDHEITIRLIDHFRNPGHIHKRQPARRATSARGSARSVRMVLDGADCVIDGGRCVSESPQPLSIL